MSSPIKITSSPHEMSPDHWSQLAAGQPSSPTMSPLQQTPRDFLLNTVNQDERGARSPPVNYHSIDCLCGPDCQSECCRRKNYGRQPLNPGKTDEKLVFVPKGTSGDNCSVSSYGSTDSTEPLLRGGKVCHSPNGGPSFVVNSDRSSLNKSVRCECHVKVVDDTTRRAKIKLVTACLVALLFMIGEVIGKFTGGH